MKILFIWPNYDCPIGISIGVSYLSSILRNIGHNTEILHICDAIGTPFDIPVLLKKIALSNPDIICVSTGESHYKDMELLCSTAKDLFPKKIFIVGGIHITLNAETIFNEKSPFDYAMRGEGEEALPELINSIASGEFREDIKNVWVKKGNKIIKNPMRPLLQNFSLPHMDLDSWDFEKITKMRRGWVNISMNRGCPFRCTFCHNLSEVRILQKDYGTKTSSNKDINYLRVRNIDNMIEELMWIKQTYPYVTAFSFIDDTFTFNRVHMLSFFYEYKQKVGLPFVCLTTVNNVDDDLLKAMKDANCDLVRFGIESTTEHICKEIIKRNFSKEKMVKVFKKCEQLQLRTFSYNMIAHPGETKEEMESTMQWNAQLKPSGIRVSLGYPYKGTDYYEIADRMGLIDDSLDFHNYSTYTKFKFSKELKLWIDKYRSFFWWWLNANLDNGFSNEYRELIEELQSIPEYEWTSNPNVYSSLLVKDKELSHKLRNANIMHYFVPYGDRPDIALLYKDEDYLKKEYLDEH